MEKERKRILYAIIILILVYLLLVSIPFSLFIHNELVVSILQISMKILYIPFFFIYVKKEGISSIDKPLFKLFDLKYLPFLLITFSNYLVVVFANTPKNTDISLLYIILDIITCLLISFNEELIFRVVINKEMIKTLSRFKTILFSSLIFGLIHLVNISSLASIPYVLLQVLYSFGLGLLLSLIYTKTYNFIYIFIIHFLFDYLNGYLIPEIYLLDYNYIFFIVNASIAILLIAYGILIYIKEEKNAAKSMDI